MLGYLGAIGHHAIEQYAETGLGTLILNPLDLVFVKFIHQIPDFIEAGTDI